MNAIRTTVLFSILAATACTTEPDTKDPVTDEFSQLGGAADSFSTALTVVGALTNGQTSAAVAYTSSPKYRAFTFVGKAGDAIDAWVRSTDGDAVAWLLDDNFNIIVQDDDAPGTTDSHLVTTLTNAASQTFYIVFREYNDHRATFRVTLKGSSDGVVAPPPPPPPPPATRTLVAVTVSPYFATDDGVLTAGLGTTAPVEFVATGEYDDGTTADLTTTALWSSTNLSVISFGGTLMGPNAAEWIWGVAPGTATLVATASLPNTTVGLSGVVTLTVN